MKEAPKLNEDDIEWRVEGKPFERGKGSGVYNCLWVAYLQAPTVAGLFDEWVGPENWTDEYEIRGFSPKGTDVLQAIQCTISVRVDDDRWVSKTDVGTFSNFEAIKGAYSDSFKRCGILKWGLGRLIYDLPQIWAPCRVYTQKGGKDDGKIKIGGENDQTQGEIARQLSRLGFDGVSARVGADQSAHDDPDKESPEPTYKKARESTPAASQSAPAAPAPESPPAAPQQQEPAPAAPSDMLDHVKTRWNLLGAGKQVTMEELKGEGLFPLKGLDETDLAAALVIIDRMVEAVGIAQEGGE